MDAIQANLDRFLCLEKQLQFYEQDYILEVFQRCLYTQYLLLHLLATQNLSLKSFSKPMLQYYIKMAFYQYAFSRLLCQAPINPTQVTIYNQKAFQERGIKVFQQKNLFSSFKKYLLWNLLHQCLESFLITEDQACIHMHRPQNT